MLIFSIAFAIITFILAIMDEVLFMLITFIMLCFSAGCIAGIHIETAREADDIEKEIADLLEYEDITDKYLDPDAEEETEDLNVTFGVNTQQAASACKELATANVSEPKSAMEVFDTLTPEQKAVVQYLIGDLQHDLRCQNMLAASEEEILAMQHIQDLVQANTAKRMNDIWRLHI
jgi:hypothetical protein